MKRITVFLILIMPAFVAADAVPRLYFIGDSTAASYPENRYPLTGWAQVLPEYLDESQVEVVNRAVSGRSSKSFLKEGRWEPIRADLKHGDFVFIQFGHNDQKKDDPARYTDPHASYTEHLRRYVVESREAGAIPVLLTPINRNVWESETTLGESLGEYPDAVRALAMEMSVPLLDMELATRRLLERVGKDRARALFLYFAPGEQANYPEGKADGTHLSDAGAHSVAKAAAEELRRLGPPLAPLVID